MYIKHYIFFLILWVGNLCAQDTDYLNRKLQLTETTGSRYQLLRSITDQSGYLFIYDSETLNNDANVQIRKGEYTLRDAIYTITGNTNMQMSLIGENHIVLRLPEERVEEAQRALPDAEMKYFFVSGSVHDLFTKETLSSATVSVTDLSIGTVTNGDGRFRITLPDSLLNTTIRISHIGYESLEFKAASHATHVAQADNVSSPADNLSVFSLEPKVVSLQEVVVRVIDPKQAVRRMMDAREQNYATDHTYHTAFYREGVEHKKRNVDLTEAVLKIYKPGFEQPSNSDQVKLVKMRRIVDKQERDTIVTKMKSGIHSTLLLDLVKHVPDFMDVTSPENPYIYAHTDIAVINDRLANVISFEQRKGIREPYYKGELFIDTENHALVEARFQITPAYINKATNLFVEKRSKNHTLDLRAATYVVSYTPSSDGVYSLNHVRGELEFRVRRKRQWFSSTLRINFEFVNCLVETEDVQPIPRAERLSARSVFSETNYLYDADFWGNFNVILPEERLKELLLSEK